MEKDETSVRNQLQDDRRVGFHSVVSVRDGSPSSLCRFWSSELDLVLYIHESVLRGSTKGYFHIGSMVLRVVSYRAYVILYNKNWRVKGLNK